MEFSKKVIEIGSSLGIVLDRLIIDNEKIKRGDIVHVVLVNESRLRKIIKDVKDASPKNNKI